MAPQRRRHVRNQRRRTGKPLTLPLFLFLFLFLVPQVASDALQESITKGKVYSHLATYIRHSFDKSFGKGWNCVVGRSFGAYVTHEIKTYVYFSPTPGVCILLWRA